MKYKNGETACAGDVIRWKCWDSDDYTTWTFTGLVKADGVLYLGGGIDFGMGIGKIVSYEDVVQEADNNDGDDAGIEKIGTSRGLFIYISEFNT